MEESFEQILGQLKARGEEAGLALATEQALEDDRAAIKADAIVRVMKRDGLAATPAEKIVETDEQYFQHRAEQRESIVERFKADAAYKAAQAKATQASLITPSMVELKSRITELEKELRQAKREVVIREIATRRANSMLAEKITDAEQLDSRIRRFWETVNLMEPPHPWVAEAWKESAAPPANALGIPAPR